MKSTYNGQKSYTKLSLFFYNFRVLFFNNNFVWKCKTSYLLDQYRKFVSNNHLDIGIGTWYYLKKVMYKLKSVHLMDLNTNCLKLVSEELSYKHPVAHKIDILRPVSEEYYNMYDSISFNYLLHCLPDNGNKSDVFKNVSKMLTDNGVAFGATIINDYKSGLAHKVARKYNASGKFDNKNDTYEKIEMYIKEFFDSYEISQIGSVCLFSMKEPKK